MPAPNLETQTSAQGKDNDEAKNCTPESILDAFAWHSRCHTRSRLKMKIDAVTIRRKSTQTPAILCFWHKHHLTLAIGSPDLMGLGDIACVEFVTLEGEGLSVGIAQPHDGGIASCDDVLDFMSLKRPAWQRQPERYAPAELSQELPPRSCLQNQPHGSQRASNTRLADSFSSSASAVAMCRVC